MSRSRKYKTRMNYTLTIGRTDYKSARTGDKDGQVDPNRNYGKYATTGAGKYSFDVEDVYKDRKKGKIDKTSEQYPLQDQ
jgi:hypothetical protein